ncbi:hypothetical protein [Streptomyces toxytricini]|uniref:hypothetical protein n=1 Tax=Streptomyces toxytricini TaxID=67369 RepID=UPI0034468085
MPGTGRGQVLGDLPGGVRAQGYRAAERPQPPVLVVAAQDEQLRTGQTGRWTWPSCA